MANYDYTKYSYDELVAEITRLIQAKGTWTDAYQGSTGQVLIQLIAAMTDNLHYMLERRTEESFLPTAKLPTSVRAIANMLGYRSRRVISSSGTMNITLTDSLGNPTQPIGNVVIPKYTKLTYDDKNFVNTSEVTILPTTTFPYTFEVKEGLLETVTYNPSDITSSLYLNKYIVIENYEDIEENSLEIYTSTQTFNDVRSSVGGNPAIESLSLAGPTDQAYDIRLTNDGMRILFGDGTYGEYPTGTLTIRYIRSSGRDIEIQSTGLTFAFETTTLNDDDIPANTYNYILQNATTIDGALDAETIESTKQFAPDYVRTAARAVTKHDYRYWALQSGVGGIVDVRAFGEEEIGITVLNMNNVYIVYLTSDGSSLNTTQQQELRDYLDIYKNITTHIVLIPAETVPLQINMIVKRNPLLTASNSEVYDYIKNDLTDFFSYQNGSLDNDVYHSQLVDRYHDLTMTKNGVTKNVSEYVKVDVKALKSFSTPLSTQSTTATITYGIDGDTYRITINGTNYDYVSVPTDDANAVATNLASLVNADPAVTASATLNIISIDTVTPGTPFTITPYGTTTILNNRIDQTIQLPEPLLNNKLLEQQFLPGSIQVIQTDGTVIATDDGAGNFYNGTVSYITGEIILPIQLVNGNYYIRYEQNSTQNFIVTSKQALTYSQPKAGYTDVTELLSTITFV